MNRNSAEDLSERFGPGPRGLRSTRFWRSASPWSLDGAAPTRPPSVGHVFAGPRVEGAPGDHRGFVEPIQRTRSRLVDAGFDVVREFGSGYEEFPMLRNLPSGV